MSREKVLELVDSGVLTPYQVMLSCLNYMSQADVEDMATSEGFIADYILNRKPETLDTESES